MLARWRERDVFHESQRRREGAPRYVFYEGPPTANGARLAPRPDPRHQGHLPPLPDDAGLARRASRRVGHPRPPRRGRGREAARHQLQARDRGLRHRRVQRALPRLRVRVHEDWQALTERIGFWVDLDRAYRTLDPTYIETVWWALKKIADKGLLYEGYKVVCCWPHGGTALSSHEVALGYKDVIDPSLYVRLPVVEDGGPVQRGDELLVWTTTPWTLVANAAIAVDPELTYVRREDGRPRGTGRARGGTRRARARRGRAGARSRSRRRAGRGALRAAVPVPGRPGVGGSAGTRCCSLTSSRRRRHGHRAHGDRLRRGRLPARERYGLAVVNPVLPDGTFDERIGKYAGRFVKDADADLIEDLERRGLRAARGGVRALLPALLARGRRR